VLSSMLCLDWSGLTSYRYHLVCTSLSPLPSHIAQGRSPLRQGLHLALSYISIAAKSFTTSYAACLKVLGLVESPGCWELMGS